MQGIQEPADGGRSELTRPGDECTGREAISAWLASGEPMEIFSKKAGLSYWSLRRWRLAYGEEFGLTIRRRPGTGGKRSKQSARPPADKSSPSRLAPVTITSSTVSVPTVQITLRCGRSLCLDPGIDLQCLSRLLVAVEQAR